MNSPSKTIIGPEEEITQPNSHLAMNLKEVKTWVIDDYIIVPKLQWRRLPNIMERKQVKNPETKVMEYQLLPRKFKNYDEKIYHTLIKLVYDSRSKFDDDNLTQIWYGLQDMPTCKWCHEHWMGSGGYIALPISDEAYMKWREIYSQSPPEIADLMERIWARRPGSLAAGITSDSGRSAE